LSSTGRVEQRCDWFRPMASAVSALSSLVANGHQILPSFPPPPLILPYGEFPQYGWKPASSPRALPPASPAAFDAEPAFLSCLALGPGVSVRGCAYRPLAQRGLSSPHLQLLRRPDPPVGRTPSSLGLLGLLGPVFALAGRLPHLPCFAWPYYSSMPRPLPRWLTEFL